MKRYLALCWLVCVAGMQAADPSTDPRERRRALGALTCVERVKHNPENKKPEVPVDYNALAPLPLTYQGNRKFPHGFMAWRCRQNYGLERCLTSASDDWADVYLWHMGQKSSKKPRSYLAAECVLLARLQGEKQKSFASKLNLKQLQALHRDLMPCYEEARRLLERRTGKCFTLTNSDQEPGELLLQEGYFEYRSDVDEKSSCADGKDESTNQTVQSTQAKCIIL